MLETKTKELVDTLEATHTLALPDYQYLIEHNSQETRDYIAPKARAAADAVYGKDIFVRGLVEFSNYCKNKVTISSGQR